jgi:hypothetical protein
MLEPLMTTTTVCSRRVGTYGVAAALFGCISCATAGPVPDRGTLDTAIRARASAGIRVEGQAPLPPDASMDDGVTSQEAVAIALWNSPSFQATLADPDRPRGPGRGRAAAQSRIFAAVPGRPQAARMDAAVSV